MLVRLVGFSTAAKATLGGSQPVCARTREPRPALTWRFYSCTRSATLATLTTAVRTIVLFRTVGPRTDPTSEGLELSKEDSSAAQRRDLLLTLTTDTDGNLRFPEPQHDQYVVQRGEQELLPAPLQPARVHW